VNAPRRQSTPDEKMEFAVNLLGELGGAPKVIRENGRTLIKSESCPFVDVVTEHPEICRVAESMIGEVLARPVKEICDRSSDPKCCFVIRGPL
jgi:predicted ArsR family transcriptional regulator